MSARAPAVILLLSLCATAPSAAAAQKRAAARRSPAASVVKIFVRGEDGTFAPTGSGFFVRAGLVASARDERRDDGEIFVKADGSDRLVPAARVDVPVSPDVDLFEVDGATPPPLALARRAARVGEAVTAYGGALVGPREAKATVSRLPGRARPSDELEEQARMLAVSGAVEPANVGGPVVAADGAVLGLATALRTADGTASLVVPAKAIAASVAKRPLPVPTMAPPIVAPTTHTPPRPPSLPIIPTVQVDPALVPKPSDIGVPEGVEGPPSDGPGQGGGIGTGSGGGAPPPPVDPKTKVVTKVKVLNNPRPGYTEVARLNKTQGTVVVRVLFGADGRIKAARVVRGLPDGLNEKAIEACYKFQFVPAKNADGEPVDAWVAVQVTFVIRDGPPAPGPSAGGEPRETVHVFLAPPSGGAVEGFAIVEVAEGEFAVAAVRGTATDGSFDLATTSPVDGCTRKWTGSGGEGEVAANEARSCAAGDGGGQHAVTLRVVVGDE
jgi:TonB family protein